MNVTKWLKQLFCKHRNTTVGGFYLCTKCGKIEFIYTHGKKKNVKE